MGDRFGACRFPAGRHDRHLMPIAYTVDSYWEENGARIDLSELAPYGLMDGERYLFLQGKDGKMQFAQYAYPSLQADASLGDIEAFAKSFWK